MKKAILNQKLFVFVFAFLFSAISIAASSCGGSSSQSEHRLAKTPVVSPDKAVTSNQSANDTCVDGLAAFTKNVYTSILRQNCVQCHDTNGNGPPHSTADVNASYAAIKTYVDFAQIDKSRIISRVRSQHWLNYDAKATGTTVDIMTASLQAWYDQGEKACPNTATAASTAIVLPAFLPVYPDDRYVTLSWKLDSLGAAFVGSEFSVDIQMFAAPTKTTSGAYRLREPRFATIKPGVKIGGIQFYLNQKLQASANIWGKINAEVAGHLTAASLTNLLDDPFASAPLLSPRHLILLQDQVAGDSISVSFSGLQFSAAPMCAALPIFQTKILPVLKQNSCVSCHSTATKSTAGVRLNLATTDDFACAQARERVDFAHPEGSAFVTLGFFETLDHPPALNIPASFDADWLTWTKAETTP